MAAGEIPPSRPVVSDLTGMGVHLSNLVSTILEPISEAIPNKIDVISTEDALARIREFNMMAQTSSKEYVLVGADAVSLYPSLQAASTSKAVGSQGFTLESIATLAASSPSFFFLNAHLSSDSSQPPKWLEPISFMGLQIAAMNFT